MRPVFWVVLVLFVAATIETLSYASLHLIERRAPGTVVEIFLANHFAKPGMARKKEKAVRLTFDRDLGWVVRPGFEKSSTDSDGTRRTYTANERGARSGPGNEGALLVATYGDSFTAGVEVQNDETWQTYLAAELGGAAVNFGMAGYCTLQAVMRMERHLADGYVAPITVLGIYETNLERVVNSFRPFLLPETGVVLGFKPSLRLRNGRVEFFPSAWTDPDLGLPELEQLARGAAKRDFYAEQMGNTAFPFSYQVARMWKTGVIESRDMKRRKLWDSVEGRAVMNYLVDRFAAQARATGSEPVLLFLPSAIALANRTAPGYAGLVAEIRERHPKMTVLDIAEEEFSRPNYNVRPFKGHTSPYGNRVIASALARHLRVLFADR
jgi:hypothetical protein